MKPRSVYEVGRLEFLSVSDTADSFLHVFANFEHSRN